MEALAKDFSGYLLIKGGTDAPNGNKYLHGPAALVEEDGLGSDFDGEDLIKAAIVSGLKTFERLGGQVDWDHLFAKTHDPKHLIGKCVGIQDNPSGGAPIVTTELFMSKALARSAWEHHEAGGVLGYSLQGIAKARDPKNAKRITDLEIHMMTLTPNPKGFEGPRLTAGIPLGAIIKGLNAEVESGDLVGWEAIEEIDEVEKAMTPDETEIGGKIRQSFDKNRRLGGSRVANIGENVHTPVTHNGITQHFSASQASMSVMGKPSPIYLHSLRKTKGGSPYIKRHKLDSKNKLTDMSSLGSQAHEYPPLMDINRMPHDKFQPELESHEKTLRAGIEKHSANQPTKKALTAGSGIVQAGESSGAALRTQDLLGSPKPRRSRKPCGCKKSSGSETPCRCKESNKPRSAARQADPLNKGVKPKARVMSSTENFAKSWDHVTDHKKASFLLRDGTMVGHPFTDDFRRHHNEIAEHSLDRGGMGGAAAKALKNPVHHFCQTTGAICIHDHQNDTNGIGIEMHRPPTSEQLGAIHKYAAGAPAQITAHPAGERGHATSTFVSAVKPEHITAAAQKTYGATLTKSVGSGLYADGLNKALVLELMRCGARNPEAISRQITRSLSHI